MSPMAHNDSLIKCVKWTVILGITFDIFKCDVEGLGEKSIFQAYFRYLHFGMNSNARRNAEMFINSPFDLGTNVENLYTQMKWLISYDE